MPDLRSLVRASASVAAAALILVPAHLSAQQPPPGGPPAEEARPQGGQNAAELVFEREVFSYPTFQRRNPFRPLVGSDAGPRFESMSVQGIVFTSSDPSQSMVLMRAGGGGQAEPQSRRLRAGQRWGNVTVLEVRRREVLVEVQEFGITEQRIMPLPTPGQGGS